MIAAVIFDMDGVLVDSNEAHFLTFQKLARELGREFSRSLWSRSIGMHNSSIFPMWLGADLSVERARELALRKEAMYRELAADQLKPVRGAVELVGRLHAEGLPLAVGSSGPRANVELALKITGTAHLFKAVVTGDDAKHGKPSPEIFLTAASKLAVAAGNCLVIEDAPQGVEAALAAGMRVVGLKSEVPCDLSRATWVVETLVGLDIRELKAR